MLAFHPPVIAHRGASAYAPENTLSAFTKALQLGIRWIEFDVMLTADEKAMIFHDDLLDRTTNGVGEFEQYSYDYLRSLDAGAWFDAKFSGECIPSLKHTLEFLKNTKLAANIELKASLGKEEELVRQVLADTQEYFLLSDSNILFSSFSLEVLKILRRLAPDCFIGLLLHDWEEAWEEHCHALQCVSIHVNEEIITPTSIRQIKKMNKKLLCYTINEAKRAQELFALGVDAIFSDVPDEILLSLRSINC